MFSPRLLKYALAGAVSMLVLVTAVLGESRWRPDPDPAPDLIDEYTDILGQQWCSFCGKQLQPLTPEEYQAWRGKNQAQLEALLADYYPGAEILAFAREGVEVQFPAAPCPDCAVYHWPQRGYIGLTEGNIMAVFFEDGSLFEKCGEAQGVHLDQLKKGIPFSSPEECENLLINLTS